MSNIMVLNFRMIEYHPEDKARNSLPGISYIASM